MAVFEVNGAQGKKADTKPYVYVDDTMIKTNLTNGNYSFDNLGYGSNNTISLKGGGIVSFITYEENQSQITIPMSNDMYTLGWCKELADRPPFTLKIIDKSLGVAAVVNNCVADYPQGVDMTYGSNISLVFKGDPVEFILV